MAAAAQVLGDERPLGAVLLDQLAQLSVLLVAPATLQRPRAQRPTQGKSGAGRDMSGTRTKEQVRYLQEEHMANSQL